MSAGNRDDRVSHPGEQVVSSPQGMGDEYMYDELKRHEVQVLNNAGLSVREISRKANVPIATVWRILKEPEIATLEEQRSERRIGRPLKAREYEEEIRGILSPDPEIKVIEILRRIREKGYKGGKTPVYELVSRIRPKIVTPVVRFEGLAGEFSQHDFGEVRVKYRSGKIEKVHFFASRLKYSRWAHVVLVKDQGVESLVRSLLEGFESFQGLPLVCVFDNPKTIVIERVDGKIEWNSTFAQVALDMRFAPELCAPRRANQKGSVENLVGWVKGSFFKVRSFHDEEDLETELKAWLKETNELRPSRATGEIPLKRMEEERKRLRPLVYKSQDYPLRFPKIVGPTGWVDHEGIRYSMPAGSIGIPGTLYLYPQRVRIVASRFDAEHPRYPQNGKSSFRIEDQTSMLAAVSGERAKLYYKRQRLLELGSDVEEYLTEIVHRRVRTWKGDVESLYEAVENYGSGKVIEAISFCKARMCFGSEYVVEKLNGGRAW